ncbi:citrate lyase beta subunit [Paenibacillus shirakamiensis]|uniref:Citrate lyase beta subunit n=1 Tax=Paenibacillus shirakamiensis TaxID=1265935 RepID=A0ABS4JGK2_9BACL|nr:HpcH/HpaI aldolase/citrate lyase family protein [Paenibacillus shirakamiensis]MBP2000842.1 citrate lyase beta subunit [Paenibacillus shirakamiensis]
MRYFDYLSSEEENSLFYSAPTSFSNYSPKDILAYAVGAALYMPATREGISDEILNRKIKGLVTKVIDLEDAIGENQVPLAEESLCQQIWKVHSLITTGSIDSSHLPLIFIRVRNGEQLQRLIDTLGESIAVITGFTLPKFSMENGKQYFEIISSYNMKKPSSFPTLYGMPILETADVIYLESRTDTLLNIKSLLHEYKDFVLNVRIGATDFSSLFGLRRSPDMTIYDISVIRDCIADIVNMFGRFQDHFVISGPVWEYFKSDRVLKPQLRQTPFEDAAGSDGRKLRMDYINIYVDGLLREVMLDKENGIIGKTIIHPSHILPVQSLYAVTHEEYCDALNIMEHNHGNLGVFKSQYKNKMNEIKPHLNWADGILKRSKIYGVLNEHKNFTSLLIGQDEFAQREAFV